MSLRYYVSLSESLHGWRVGGESGDAHRDGRRSHNAEKCAD